MVMVDYSGIMRAAFTETLITLPNSGAQIAVMLVDDQYMSGFDGLYFSARLESVIQSTIALSHAAKYARSTFVHELGHALHDQYDAQYSRHTKEFLEGVAKTIERLHDGISTGMRDIDVLDLLEAYPDEYWDCHTGIARTREIHNGENFAIRLWKRIRRDIALAESTVGKEYTSVFGEHWCTVKYRR